MAKQSEICFLCGKAKSEVNQLLKGKFGYVCDECVHDTYEIFNEQEEKEIAQNMQMFTPSEIKNHLDSYIIGQDEAKKR